MIPPKTTAFTVPINRDVSPLSNAPNSLDEPTNMEFTEKQQSQLINQFIDNTKESKLVAQAALSATSTEFLMSVRKNPNTSNLNYTDIISAEIHKEKMKLVDQDKQVSYTDLPESV